MSENGVDCTINTDQEYYAIQATLTRQSRPHAILRALMGLFESYRSARKIGWSRPWNKYDVMNFQSLQLDVTADSALLDLTQDVLATTCPVMPSAAQTFVESLFAGREQLRGFLFFQEYSEAGRHFEGANLSLGRRAAGHSRYRDRLDIIFDSPIEHGASQGLTRLRIFVDPYTGNKEPLWSTVVADVENPAIEALFAQLADASWTWANEPQRLWDHWTSAYIHYFGPRQWPIHKSYFYVPNMPHARLVISRPVADASLHTEATTI